jgi:hypothetical protein
MSATDKKVSHPKIELTTQQKLDYCLQWESSGMRKAEFCKRHGFSVSRFYYWYHHMYLKSKNQGKGQEGQWSPVVSDSKGFSTREGSEQIEVILPNQVILRLLLPSSRVVSFIEELSHAAAIIR